MRDLHIPSVLIGFMLGILAVTLAVFIAIPLRSTPTPSGAADLGTPLVITVPSALPAVTPTAPPSPSPAASGLPTPFEPITFTGKSDKVIHFVLGAGQVAIATMRHTGKDNFAVWSLAADGSQDSLLANAIGSYAGTVLIGEDTGMSVEASGPWSIIVKPLLSARQWTGAGKTVGAGDDVLVIPDPASVGEAWTFTHAGSDNFAVVSYTLAGDRNLLVNTIGRYDGQVEVDAGTAMLEITASGAWTITAP